MVLTRSRLPRSGGPSNLCQPLPRPGTPPARRGLSMASLSGIARVIGWLTMCMAVPGAAVAEDAWELTPCRIKVAIVAADGECLTPYRRETLATGLVARTDTLIGAAWQLSCVDAPPAVRAALAAGAPRLTFNDLDELTADCDVLALVAIEPAAAGCTVRIGQWDVATQQLAGAAEGWVPAEALVDGVFRLLFGSFSPLAKIEPVDLRTVRLRFRGADLPPRVEPILRVHPGDIFRAVVRNNERDGRAKSIRLVEWTYLVVTRVADGEAICQVQSGMRSPLGGRRRGRTEHYALELRTPPGVTRVLLRSRSDPERKLAGYDLYAYGPESKATEHLGRTGLDGGIDVPPGPQRLRLLLVKHGDALVARLPIVPGESPRLTALVPDDDRRLQAEGLIVGLQENLVDLVVRRTILVAQVRSAIQDGRLDEARQFIDELRRLRTQQQFLLQLEQERQRLVTTDPVVQRKIDKLFDDTTKLLGSHLLPQELETLEAEWNRARAKAGQPPAAANSADSAAEAKARSAPDATRKP